MKIRHVSIAVALLSTLAVALFLFSCTNDLIQEPPGSADVSLAGAPATVPADTACSLTWSTNLPTKFILEFGTSADDYANATVLNTEDSLDHAASLGGLTPDTTYYFRVRSFYRTYQEILSEEYSFRTLPNSNVISMSQSPVAVPSSDSLAISWQTNCDTTSSVEYGTVSGVYSSSLPTDAIATASHTRVISGLSIGTTYYYRILSFAAGRESAMTEELTATTLYAIQITAGPTVTPADTQLTIAWTTNYPTRSVIEYGTASGVYTDSLPQDAAESSSHSRQLTGLTQGTRYYFRIVSTNATYGTAPSAEFDSMTTTPLAISAGPSAIVGMNSIGLTWSTNYPTTSLVEYGTSPGSYELSLPPDSVPSSDHSRSLIGLSRGMTYYYRVHSSSVTYGSLISTEYSATTNEVLEFVSGPTAVPSATNLEITWSTNRATASILDYGVDSGVYPDNLPLDALETVSHTRIIPGLTQGKLYYYRIRSSSATWGSLDSPEYTAITTPVLAISSGPTATPAYTSIALSWDTNYATKSIVEYGTVPGTYTDSLPIDPAELVNHSRTLSGLIQGKEYFYRIQSFSSAYGNLQSIEYSATTLAEPAPTLEQKLRGIWIVGGLSSNAIGSVIGDVDLYDPEIGAWYPAITSLPTPVSFAGAESYEYSPADHRLYVIGGFNSGGAPQTLVQVYSVELDSWTTPGDGQPLPAARANIFAIQLQNSFYVLGGTTGLATAAFAGQTTTYRYYPASDSSWETRTAFATACSERLTYSFGDIVYNIGGRNTAAAVAAPAHDGFSNTSNALTTGVTETVITTPRTGISGRLWTPAVGPARFISVGGFSALTGTTGCFINQGTTTATGTALVHSLNYPFAAPAAVVVCTAYPNNIGFGAAAIYGNAFYYFGGTIGLPGTGQATSYSADLAGLPSIVWTPITPMPSSRWGHAAVTMQ